MNNRPQFFFKTPPGYRDEPFVRPVVVSQDISGPIPVGGTFLNYVVQMDYDAPQILRSIFWEGEQQNQKTQFGGSVHVQIRDPRGYPLTDGFVPLWLYAFGAGNTPPDGGSGRAKVFESEIYCPPGSVLLFDFLNAGLPSTGLPSFGAPARQSLIHTAVQMETQVVGGSGQAANVFRFGGNLYQVLQFTGIPYPGGIGSVNVYRSTDNGATWTILDGAHSPLHSVHGDPCAGVFYDGANTITVASTVGSTITPAANPILLQDFDLVSGTWGAVYGAGSGNVFAVNQCFKRSDGSLLVIAVDAISPSILTAYVFAGGVWSNFPLLSLLPGGWTSNGLSSTVYDPATGTIHMFGIAFTFGPVKHQYYQQILLSNTVAGFQDMTGVYTSASAMGSPLIYGGKLVWGVVDAANTFATILVGAPLSAPVFTVAGSPGILPGQPIPGLINTLQPTLATDGVNLWAVFVASTFSFDTVYLSVTSNTANPLTGWAGGIIYNDSGALNGIQYPSMSVLAGLPYITIQSNLFGQPTNFFFAPTAAPVLPVTFPGYFELRGVKRHPEKC